MKKVAIADFGKSAFLGVFPYAVAFEVLGVKNYNYTVESPYRIDQSSYRAELDISGRPAEQTISTAEMFSGGKLVVKTFDGNLSGWPVSLRGAVGNEYLHVTLENIPYGKVQCTLYELRSADGKVRWHNPDA